MDDKEWHVCGLVIQAKPARIAPLIDSLLAIPGTEIPTSDTALGKLVVVMQAARSDVLLNYIESARNLDGVLAVSLVYHQQDQQGEEMP
ncbi:chaperone NapD [Yersinia enterocolitica]|uniref:Chaperone NapD n=3 Tax=Yersinia TaxID=629 RepID=A0A9P1PSS6_YEREN|nr:MULTISPECIES: chaperone NapD [Yersinia]AJI86156.1 napD family protein [Yersinia frederiksenii Y225]CNH01367.1 assembly protein for periplasmic nitrate reductase [Yersinia kristensenii]CNL01485.1 assembly protein for periplasmic nitrate reductase [Yersinia intermedia]AIN20383.1 napD family protein [Yersinia rochesterensis]AJJ34692.1 napD family protein [Yersinia rochesterensis]